MKIKIVYVATLVLVMSLSNCKKESPATENSNQVTPYAELSLATASVTSIGVQTLYGTAHAPGALVNGHGSLARFYNPRGIQLMPDGTIYVADTKNNAVRMISPMGIVSTVPLQTSDSGIALTEPIYIAVEYTTGKIHIIQNLNADGDPFDQSWIFDTNGKFIATSSAYYTSAAALARDPYSDIAYFSNGGNIEQHLAQPSGEIYGSLVPFDYEKLEEPEKLELRGFRWDAIAIGYNKVVYFTTNGRIYKYTPGGVTERIFPNLETSHITSMVFNKDSRTMYFADNGYIKRVDGNKLTVLAGPTGTNDGNDGAASTADVYAFGLALAKGENSLYFTDLKANTIRRIYLK